MQETRQTKQTNHLYDCRRHFASAMNTTTFTAITADGFSYEISRKAARHSGYFRGLLEDFAGFSMPDAIPVEYISSEKFEKLLEYMNHYENSEPAQGDKIVWRPFKEVVPEWDCQYLDMSGPELFELNASAEYLMIEPLLELIAFNMACETKDMTVEQACDFYGRPRPTEEQLKEIEKIYWEQYALPADL